MAVLLKNNVSSTLATAITASDTAIVVADGSQFPAPTGGDYFFATLVSPAGVVEVVKVTARVSNSLTVVRAQDDSLASSFQVGSLVEMRVSAASVQDAVTQTLTQLEAAFATAVADQRTTIDVAELLADTTFTYTPGTDDTVVAGNIIRTRAEGFAYEVAAANAVPATSSVDGYHLITAGGVKLFVRPSGSVISVKQFGATGDGSDEAAKLQAFFNHAWILDNAKRYTYDVSGKYTIGSTIIAAYPSSPIQERHFVGQLELACVAGQTLDYAIVINGYNQKWDAFVKIGESSGGLEYATRPFRRGVRMFGVNSSRFQGFWGRGIKRDLVYWDPKSTSETFQAGTPYETVQANSNNIGAFVEYIYGSYVGSYVRQSSDNLSLVLPVSANVQSGAVNSNAQRSALTVTDTSELEVNDLGFMAIEATPADYGTITADNATSTFTWASGDPATVGFAVGDEIQFIGGAGQANNGYDYRITNIAGTVITVTPAPITSAANAGLRFQTVPALHQIMSIPGSTQIDVFPWVDSRANSPWRSIHGSVCNVLGSNTANLRLGTVVGFISSNAFSARCLYGPKVATILAESVSIGLVTGATSNSANLGNVINHVHFEGTTLDYVQISSTASQSTIIEGDSSFGYRALRPGDYHVGRMTKSVAFTPRSNTTSGFADRQFLSLSIRLSGDEYNVGQKIWGSYRGVGNVQIDNTPANRNRTAQVLAGFSTTITVGYDRDCAKLFPDHHWATVYWARAGTVVGAPTTSITFALNSVMVAEGWTVLGQSVWTTPAAPMMFHLVYDDANKRVSILPFTSSSELIGSATYNPPSLNDGDGDTTTVTVSGAALGDIATASFSLDVQGIGVTAWVSAADTVSVRFQNETGGTLDLGSGTLRAFVRKV